MLKWSLENKEALVETLPEMNRLNWGLFSIVCSFLEQFDVYTKKYSRESTAIANLLMDYDSLIENVRKVASKSDFFLKEPLKACLEKLEKYYIYFDYPVYYVSTCIYYYYNQ
jgi:hypothetical protein